MVNILSTGSQVCLYRTGTLTYVVTTSHGYQHLQVILLWLTERLMIGATTWESRSTPNLPVASELERHVSINCHVNYKKSLWENTGSAVLSFRAAGQP
jgi:hypothetical protein